MGAGQVNTPIISAMRIKLSAEEGISAVGYDYWNISPATEEMEAVSETDRGFIGHAGELETSLQLYLQPHLVDMDSAEWTLGVCGNPSVGSRQKGERIVNAAVGALVKMLRDYHSGKLEEGLTIWRPDVSDEQKNQFRYPRYSGD